jgi:hypothetical protein
MKITKSQAIKLANKYKINLDVIDINEWQYGLNVELEHGSKFGTFTNITNNNLSITSKIVIAHLTEFPDYYKRLLKLETQADKYWSSRNKPNIFI